MTDERETEYTMLAQLLSRLPPDVTGSSGTSPTHVGLNLAHPYATWPASEPLEDNNTMYLQDIFTKHWSGILQAYGLPLRSRSLGSCVNPHSYPNDGEIKEACCQRKNTPFWKQYVSQSSR